MNASSLDSKMSAKYYPNYANEPTKSESISHGREEEMSGFNAGALKLSSAIYANNVYLKSASRKIWQMGVVSAYIHLKAVYQTKA